MLMILFKTTLRGRAEALENENRLLVERKTIAM